ncbi:MAG: hypothetical protein E7053_08505 [Lentisphaerae bacterium]|nr:hypothetical protein [Lentisphaerota bacterium]
MKHFLFVLLLSVGFVGYGADGDGSAAAGNGGRGGYGQRGGRGNHGQTGGRGGFGMMQNGFFAELELARRFPDEYAEVEALRERYEAALAALAAKGGVTLPESRDAAFRRLRKADPAAFDAAVELMKTSPQQGMAQLMELARRHNIELFPGRPGGGQRPGVSGAPGSGQRPGGAAPGGNASASRRNFNRPDMAALRRKYPERMREYDALRRRDPAAAREMLLQIIELDRGTAQ